MKNRGDDGWDDEDIMTYLFLGFIIVVYLIFVGVMVTSMAITDYY